MQEQKHTTHSHASSSVHVPVHQHEQANIECLVTCRHGRVQDSEGHASEDGEDGNADGGADTVEEQAKGLVELEQVVPLEEDGDGVGDDADEDMDDGKHCCCEVGLVIVGVYDVLLRMVLLAEVL